jgi:DNA repair protein SbcC/Rad50
MLGWIFKKKGNAALEAASAIAAESPPSVAAPPAPAVDWTAKLAQARDDDALLALARTAGVPLQYRQAAVEALEGEAALKLAEHEFRSHDRRVHQLAKRRLLAKVAQRQTREQAARLIESARRLAGETDVPVNRGVELDHAWQALEAAAIEPAQRDEFAALTAQLAARARRRADTELQRKRWRTEAVQALRQLQVACAEAASGTQARASLADAVDAARRVVEVAPPEDDPAARVSDGALADLRHALQIAAALDGHLAVLDRLLAEPAGTASRAADDPAINPGVPAPRKADAGDEVDMEPALPTPAVDDAQREWQALAPLSDTHLAALLQARHARWQQACDQARNDRQSQRGEQARKQHVARNSKRVAALVDGIVQAETALDAGQLADAHRHLSHIDDELQGAEAPDALRGRIAAAQARLAQLRGWQHWAGGRARDELVLQAEALAAATVGAGAGQHGGEAEGGGASEADAEVARLSIRQRAEVIATLRARWKEVDRLGGAGGRALWQRFDAAMKAAHEPVAEHVAALRAARETNLSARHQLLDVLAAVGAATTTGLAESAQPAVPADDAEQPQTKNATAAEASVEARALATTLDRFHVEWRKLGPLEHTVPRAARAALVERMEAAVRRLEAPLQAARRQARAEREALVTRACALVGDGPGRGRDLAGEVRALQAEWQQRAKALPLARADEQALWTDFKAAIDAAFVAREAVFSAREAEFEAHAAERAALIERLKMRPEDSLATQRRTLAEVDAAWQRCGPAPRARAAALDAEFRATRQALRQWLDNSTQRAWLSTCDALDAKLALCLAREQGATADAADVDTAVPAASWQALPVLPPPFEDALRRRAGHALTDGTDTAPSVDDLLLQIEAAWDLPTPPAFESARRERKLMAMKVALEGRRTGAPEALVPDAALALLLGRGGLDAGQRDRLAAVLTAWRGRGPQHLP